MYSSPNGARVYASGSQIGKASGTSLHNLWMANDAPKPKSEYENRSDANREDERDDDRAAQARHERAHGETERDRERREDEEERERDDDLDWRDAAEQERKRADRREHDDVHRDRRVRGDEFPARDVLRREAREQHRFPRATLALRRDRCSRRPSARRSRRRSTAIEKNVWKSAPPSDAGVVLSAAAMPPMEHMRSEIVRRQREENPRRATESRGLTHLAHPDRVRLAEESRDASGAAARRLGAWTTAAVVVTAPRPS